MKKIFYLNVNGFYGLKTKNIDKLKVGLDDNCCMKNAEQICKQICNNGILKYDVVFFAEFAPNTPSGKSVTDYLDKQGYRLVLPNASDYVEDCYYSIVVAYVKKNLNIVKSVASPKGWLTWCELYINNIDVVGIHSTRTEFLLDMMITVSGNDSYKDKGILIFGDKNVTEKSEEQQKLLLGDIIECVGTEVIDSERKNTFKSCKKPDRVFSNIKNIQYSVIDEFVTNEFSDHDAISITLQ